MKIFPYIVISKNFDQNPYFRKLWPELIFTENLTRLNILKNFDENPDFSKVLNKIKILPKVLTKIEII